MELAKEQAKRALEALPDDATWEEIMYRLYVTEKITAGLKDIEEGRMVSHQDVKKRFNLE